jgi:hypothetical protein
MKTLRLGLMFWAAAALAQFPFPGQQYPGGGRRIPQQQQQQQQPTQSNRPVSSSTDGMVRRVSGNQLVIQPDDHRVVWFRITAQTTANKNGNRVDVGSFLQGDRVTVEGREDAEGNLTAVDVAWERAGTPSERAAAQETWDMPGIASSMAPAGTPRHDSSNVDDDDRPILRRQNNGDAPAPSAQQSQPQAPAQAANTPAGTPADDDSGPTRPATQIAPPAAPQDPDDPGRPVLRRGGAAVARQPDTTGASADASGATANNPPLVGAGGATQSASASRPPSAQAILPQEDPLILKVREAAYNFSSSLPNFMCQQATTRYRTQNVRQGWDTIDIVTADVAYEDGQERYRNIRVGNGSTVQNMDEIGGTRSTGEFSSMLQDLMSEATGATFRRDVTDTIHGRSAIVFKVDVPRERSHWRVEAPSQLYYPAYRGSIWVDKATSRVLRIELQARNLPIPFPFDVVESATDYDFIRLAAGEQEYLLPANAEVLSCERGTSFCSRNRIEFRNYKKFDAATSISFK